MKAVRVGGGDAVWSTISAGAILMGILLAFGVIIVGSALLGVVYSLTEWDALPWVISAFNYVSVAVGGLLAGRRAGRVGWMHGALVAGAYMLLVALIGSGFTNWVARFFDWTLLGALAAGALGGILGVNSR